MVQSRSLINFILTTIDTLYYNTIPMGYVYQYHHNHYHNHHEINVIFAQLNIHSSLKRH